MSNEIDTQTKTTADAANSPYQSPTTTSPGGGGLSGGIAPLGPRVIAMIIDIVVYTLLILVPLFILPRSLQMIGYLPGLAYFLLRDGLPFLDGQSVGKKLMKIRAVTSDGKSLSGNWGPALIRNVVYMIPCFAIVELIVLITRQGKPQQGLRLGDDWAKTKVITVN
ncbi:MAG: RDD family protein [Akkermansiaceae bacterium]|nr:RDD family protein [Akkermansiaceae bacterium]